MPLKNISSGQRGRNDKKEKKTHRRIVHVRVVVCLARDENFYEKDIRPPRSEGPEGRYCTRGFFLIFFFTPRRGPEKDGMTYAQNYRLVVVVTDRT